MDADLPSGRAWVARFPGSASLDDLDGAFRQGAVAFVAALRAARATVTVSATLRPPQRAYLMHWAWKIVRASQDPRLVPAMAEVLIRWAHVDASGQFSPQASLKGAAEMVEGFGLTRLGTAPALSSRHTAGRAIDMSIAWNGDLKIADAIGKPVLVKGTPRDGMHPDLAVVGATYGVIKYNRSGTDRPHWSDTGA